MKTFYCRFLAISGPKLLIPTTRNSRPLPEVTLSSSGRCSKHCDFGRGLNTSDFRNSSVNLFVAFLTLLGSPIIRAQLAPSAVEQIAALQADKAARTPVQQKLDSQLIYAEKERRGVPIAGGKAGRFKADAKVQADGRMLLDIDANVTPALLAEIQRVGGTVITSVPGFRSVRVLLPLQQVEPLAQRGDMGRQL